MDSDWKTIAMFHKEILVLALAVTASCLAKDCMETNSGAKRCLNKSEMGGLASYMVGGDPCFLNNGARVWLDQGLSLILLIV